MNNGTRSSINNVETNKFSQTIMAYHTFTRIYMAGASPYEDKLFHVFYLPEHWPTTGVIAGTVGSNGKGKVTRCAD